MPGQGRACASGLSPQSPHVLATAPGGDSRPVPKGGGGTAPGPCPDLSHRAARGLSGAEAAGRPQCSHLRCSHLRGGARLSAGVNAKPPPVLTGSTAESGRRADRALGGRFLPLFAAVSRHSEPPVVKGHLLWVPSCLVRLNSCLFRGQMPSRVSCRIVTTFYCLFFFLFCLLF